MNQDDELNAVVLDQARKILRLEAQVAEMRKCFDNIAEALGYGPDSMYTARDESLGGLIRQQRTKLSAAQSQLQDLAQAAQMKPGVYLCNHVPVMVEILKDHVAALEEEED